MEFLNIITELISLIVNTVVNTFQFIIAILTTLPPLIIEMLKNLPLVYQYGIEALIGCIVAILVLKLITILRSATI